jgi:hypothetical protein
MAEALIDWLPHHCHIINIRGNSYRLRHHTELWRCLNCLFRSFRPRIPA